MGKLTKDRLDKFEASIDKDRLEHKLKIQKLSSISHKVQVRLDDIRLSGLKTFLGALIKLGVNKWVIIGIVLLFFLLEVYL